VANAQQPKPVAKTTKKKDASSEDSSDDEELETTKTKVLSNSSFLINNKF
jgi:hypothetical protein